MDEDFDTLIEKASDLYAKEQYDEALIYANNAVELEPYNVSGYVWRSNIFEKKGELKNELEDVLVLKDMYRESVDISMWLACVQRKQAIIDRMEQK